MHKTVMYRSTNCTHFFTLLAGDDDDADCVLVFSRDLQKWKQDTISHHSPVISRYVELELPWPLHQRRTSSTKLSNAVTWWRFRFDGTHFPTTKLTALMPGSWGVVITWRPCEDRRRRGKGRFKSIWLV